MPETLSCSEPFSVNTPSRCCRPMRQHIHFSYTPRMSPLYQTRLMIPRGSTVQQLHAFWSAHCALQEPLEQANRIMVDTVQPFIAFGAYNASEGPFRAYRPKLFKRWDPLPFRYSTRNSSDRLIGWLRSSPDNPRIFSEAFTFHKRYPALYINTLCRPKAVEYCCQKVLRKHVAGERKGIQQLAEAGLAIIEDAGKLVQVEAWLARKAA